MTIETLLQAATVAAQAVGADKKAIAAKLADDLITRVVNEDTRPDSEIPTAVIFEGRNFRKILRDKSTLERVAESRQDGSVVEIERKIATDGKVTVISEKVIFDAPERPEVVAAPEVTTLTPEGEFTAADTVTGGAVPDAGA